MSRRPVIPVNIPTTIEGWRRHSLRLSIAKQELESQLRSLTEENERWKTRAERAEAQAKLAWEKFDKYGWETSYGKMATKLRDARRLLLSATGTPYPEDLSTYWYDAAKAFLAETDALSPIDPPLGQEPEGRAE